MYFLFDPNRIIFEVHALKKIARKLSDSVDDVKAVERDLDSDTYETVLDRLRLYENNLSESGIRMDNLSQGLSLVRDDYFNTENMILGKDGAPDWLKLIGEGKDAFLDWLDGLLHGDGSIDTDVPWIVAMGGHSMSIFNSLFGGVLPFTDNANGINGWSLLGDSVIGTTGDIFGLGEISGAADWHLLHFTESENAGYVWNFDENNSYAGFNDRLGFSVLDGSVSGNLFGIGSGAASLGLLNVGAAANVGGSMYVDGEFDPGLYANISGNASVLNGSASAQLGNENNIHVGANGSALSANAGVTYGAGRIVTDDGDVVHGVSGGIDVGASLLQGEVSGGFEFWGIKVEGGVSGALGDVGITAGGEITTGSVGINLGAGLVAGLGFRVNVDWTDFEMPEIEWPEIEWPEIEWPEIEWPEIDFEWPDWELPEIDLPDWMSW